MGYCFMVTVKDGKIIFANPKVWEDFLKTKTGTFVLSLEDSRTEKQNKLYWAYIDIISDTTGEDAKRLHYIFKRDFLDGDSTTLLSPKKFVWYLEKIREKMSEFNINLPEPEDKQDQ